jgi:hypothetical protein
MLHRNDGVGLLQHCARSTTYAPRLQEILCMTQPMIVDLPHSLGQAEAKRRIAGGIGRITDHLPPGARVSHDWSGDKLELRIQAMRQEVTARIDVQESIVRLEVQLPAFLSFFGSKIERLIRAKGTELLEDKSGGRKA